MKSILIYFNQRQKRNTVAKDVTSKYKNFLNYDEDHEYSSRVKSSKRKRFDEEKIESKKNKQKRVDKTQYSFYED